MRINRRMRKINGKASAETEPGGNSTSRQTWCLTRHARGAFVRASVHSNEFYCCIAIVPLVTEEGYPYWCIVQVQK